MGGERNLHHEGAARVVEWMMRDGRHVTRMREFGDEMCRRIADAGIPLWRAFCSVGTLHPEIAGSAYVWRRDEGGAERVTGAAAVGREAEWPASRIGGWRAER